MAIVIVDYNMGNLRSVSKAVEALGGTAIISRDAETIRSAEKLILPGVGAFGDAMQELQTAGLREPVREFARSGKPFLGICLGLQLLFEASEESPGVEGLGIFKGTVARFRSDRDKIPHMGWNTASSKKKHSLLQNLPDPSYFYFVHSFYACPESPALTLAATTYAGVEFPAILGSDSVFAAQFHPEKSQADGLCFLRNFVSLS